jgi:hypothetical protein
MFNSLAERDLAARLPEAKPSPAKPSSIIAQVDGSGTAAAMPEIRGWSNVPKPAEDVSD